MVAARILRTGTVDADVRITMDSAQSATMSATRDTLRVSVVSLNGTTSDYIWRQAGPVLAKKWTVVARVPLASIRGGIDSPVCW